MLKLITLHSITILLQLAAFISLVKLVKHRDDLDYQQFTSHIVQAIAAYAFFAFMLTIHPPHLADRIAIYGMFSIALSLCWMFFFEGQRPFYADMIGLTKFLLGVGLITISIAFS